MTFDEHFTLHVEKDGDFFTVSISTPRRVTSVILSREEFRRTCLTWLKLLDDQSQAQLLKVVDL